MIITEYKYSKSNITFGFVASSVDLCNVGSYFMHLHMKYFNSKKDLNVFQNDILKIYALENKQEVNIVINWDIIADDYSIRIYDKPKCLIELKNYRLGYASGEIAIAGKIANDEQLKNYCYLIFIILTRAGAKLEEDMTINLYNDFCSAFYNLKKKDIRQSFSNSTFMFYLDTDQKMKNTEVTIIDNNSNNMLRPIIKVTSDL